MQQRLALHNGLFTFSTIKCRMGTAAIRSDRQRIVAVIKQKGTIACMDEFYNMLDELYAAGDLAAVEAYIRGAVDASEDELERAGLLNELAGFFRGVSRYDESEAAFLRALRIFDNAGMALTPQYATVLLNLAGLHRIRGDVSRAVELFLDAKMKIEDAGASDSYEYISVLNNLSLAYQDTGEHDSALDFATRAFELINAGEDNEHEVATSLNNLATINLSLGRLEKAEEHITAAMAIYNTMSAPNVHHAAALTTMGVIQCREGKYREALEGFKRALELTRRFFGENIEFATCKRNISDVYELLGDITSAIAEQADAVRVLDKLLGADHPSARSAREKLEKLGAMSGQGFEASV